MKNRFETLQELTAFIECDVGLSSLRDLVAQSLSADPGHDLSHALRVALWTLRLGGNEVCPREAVAAAFCHDLVQIPKDSPRRAEASELSAKAARRFLPDHGFDTSSTNIIADAIRDHSFSRGAIPTTPLGRALQDADRLEALGAIGIMRNISTGLRMGAGYFDPADPWASARPLDDRAFSVDHFFTKLFRLQSTMCTSRGRSEAERRVRLMLSFIDELAIELATPRPCSSHENLESTKQRVPLSLGSGR